MRGWHWDQSREAGFNRRVYCPPCRLCGKPVLGRGQKVKATGLVCEPCDKRLERETTSYPVGAPAPRKAIAEHA